MCGIVVQWNRDDVVSSGRFDQAVEELVSRGPDGRGVRFCDSGRLALGHRRLSIIDLTEGGAQPMSNEDGTVWLTFNGEIYNFQQLRNELASAGHVFRSNSDSEVIVHAYEEWGTDCVKFLSGIFSFAIFDERNESLFLARDPLGVKPLYVYEDPKCVIFASQPRAILSLMNAKSEPDIQGLSLYLAYGYTPSNRTVFENIKKIPAGHTVVFEKENRCVRTSRYWRLKHRPILGDRRQAEIEIRDCVSRCVARQTVSDVPFGVFLSGGIDSSVLVSIASGIQVESSLSTFTIGFDVPESDERKFATAMANYAKTDHYEKLLTVDDAIEMLPRVADAYDEPFALTSAIPSFAVAQLALENQTKVVLGGDGVDELFAGYRWYDKYVQQAGYRRSRKERLRRLMGKSARDPVTLYRKIAWYHTDDEIRETFDSDPNVGIGELLDAPFREAFDQSVHDVTAAQMMDIETFLVDHVLHKVDRATMANGVECRVPFLDTELVELAFRIDSGVIYGNRERKSVFKSAIQDLVPTELLSARKKGFSSPDQLWMKEGLADLSLRLLRDGYLAQSGIIDRDLVVSRFERNVGTREMLLLGLELWARRWLGGCGVSEIATATKLK